MSAQGPLLGREECERIFAGVERAARALGVGEVEAMFGGDDEALTRFANNAIHQNVSERTRWLSVRAVLDQRTARATTNKLDNDSIDAVVQRAIALARAREPDPELLPLAEPAEATAVERYSAATAGATPAERAAAVAEAVALVEAAGQTAAGIYATGQSIDALFNSRGLRAWYCDTAAQFSITAMAPDSSGWAKASATDHRGIDPVGLARSASRKAALSAAPREIAPGRYTVILEPAAVLDLVGQMIPDFSATSLADRRSFLTERLGKALFDARITIHDDAYHALQTGSPFDGEGVPRRRLTLVEAGVPREVAYSRSSAARAGVTPTGHGLPLPSEAGETPVNIVIAGGDTSIEQMIASTPRGILVTRLWYIREVDPYEKIMTGMTRDGTFLIENGEVTRGIRNFRFNQSIIDLLSNVEALSPAVRASGEETFDMVVPALKVGDFHFSEVTRF